VIHLAIAAAAIALLSGPAAAQTSIEVSPLRVELKVAAGGSHTQAVTLTNQGTSPVRIRARVDDWLLSKDGTPQFQPAGGTAEFSASGWVRLAPPEQIVEPGRQGTVRFTATVPAGMTDGGYRSAIMFEFGPPGATLAGRGRDVVFRSRVATLVYITVGSPRSTFELTDLAGRLVAGQPPQVVATLKNTGRAHVRTRGTMAIHDAGGRLVRQIDVPNVPVLPNSEREVAIATGAEGQDPLPEGEYRIEVRIDVGMPELLVGETTIKIPAAAGKAGVTSCASLVSSPRPSSAY
jgi:P pilus assembly chaperone PapD